MKFLLPSRTTQFLPLWLIIVMIVGVVLTPTVEAKRILSNNGTGGSTEGDPLDANDYGTGGGGLIGDDIQSNHGGAIAGGGLLIPVPARDATVFLVVDFQGTIPVIRVVKLSHASAMVEAPDAR